MKMMFDGQCLLMRVFFAFPKVVSILSQVQESCSPDEARLLDKVMEFLKREGLYSPQVKDMRVDDPVATDLLTSLLTVITHILSSDKNAISFDIVYCWRTYY